ncbi:PQQ-binding-like beta-propeller repeat protein [Planctomycetota bacterium]
MKRILLIFCFFAPLLGEGDKEIAPYLVKSVKNNSFNLPEDKEIEEYFTKISEIRGKDISAAVKNYQKFIRKFGSRVCKSDDMFTTVTRKVHRLLCRDQELLEEYRRQFGPTALEGFKKARAGTDISLMEQNVRLYLPAEYGINAVSFLASYYLDHGSLDKALLYMDMLRCCEIKEKDYKPMRKTLLDLVTGKDQKKTQRDFTFKNLNTERPSWIGGIVLSTVYPEEVKKFRPTKIVYPVLFREGRVIVNTGQDIYCYDEITGKHVWKPGPYHKARTASIFRGDVIGTSRPKPNPYFISYPAGTLAAKNGKVAASINKTEKATRVAVCRFSSGKMIDEISGESLADLMKMKGIKLSWGRPDIGFMPWIENDIAYIGIRYIPRKREQGFLAAYSFSEKKLLWVTETYEARFTYRSEFDHPESLVCKAGPYLAVFSYTGYVGVFNVFDGSLIWQRFLLPDQVGQIQKKSDPRIFLPIAVPGYVIIEGPLKSHLTAYDIASGSIRWTAGPGDPLWAFYTEKGLICAVRKDEAVSLVNIDLSTGAIKWEYTGISPFPGCRAGEYMFCSDEKNVLKINLENGSVAEKVQLKGCMFPGRIFVTDRLFVVNTAGIFAYANK